MSREIKAHGLEPLEEVFSQQAVYLIRRGQSGVEPGKLRSLNRDRVVSKKSIPLKAE